MKNAFVLILVLLGLTSCSKDTLDQNIDSFIKPVKSEIFINVTSIHWTQSADNGCSHSNGNNASFISDAKVELYKGEKSDTDIAGEPMLSVRTDQSGNAVMKEIEPSTYTISVETPLGQKSRIVTTQVHKRSYIDFSF